MHRVCSSKLDRKPEIIGVYVTLTAYKRQEREDVYYLDGTYVTRRGTGVQNTTVFDIFMGYSYFLAFFTEYNWVKAAKT